MKSLVITPKNEEDLRFFKSLFKKLGYSSRELSEDELEDAGLLYAIVSEKKWNYVSEDEVMDALKWMCYMESLFPKIWKKEKIKF